jgi:hypothetical protein
MGLTELMVLKAHKVLLEQLALLEQMEMMVLKVYKVLLEQMERMVLMEPTV